MAGATDFYALEDLGQLSQDELMRTFNMGIGLIAAIPAAKFTKVKTMLDRAEEKFYVIGRVTEGDRKVHYRRFFVAESFS